MYSTEVEGSTPWARFMRKKPVASVESVGCERRNRSAPTGLAAFQENGARRSRGRDSGNANKPQQTFASDMAAAAQNGRRGEMPPSRPPNAGPVMKPTPKAAPIRPKAWL